MICCWRTAPVIAWVRSVTPQSRNPNLSRTRRDRALPIACPLVRLRPRAAKVALNLRTNAGDELIVLNTGGASSGTGKATEAAIEVTNGSGGKGRFTFIQGIHQVDTAPRGVIFFANDAVARTSGQAKTTVNTSVNQRLSRRLDTIKIGAVKIGAIKSEGHLLRHLGRVGTEARVQF